MTSPDNRGPVDATAIPRFAGPQTFARLPRLDEVGRADVAVMGVPFDSGVSYRPGARFGPAHIRASSKLLRDFNPVLDVAPFAVQQVADAGDLACNPFDIETAVKQIDDGARAVLDSADKLITIGGDHTIALPLLRVMHEMHGPIAVVHFDAHLDTWDTYFGAPLTHGTPFRRASEEGLIDKTASMHVGIRGPLYSRQDLDRRPGARLPGDRGPRHGRPGVARRHRADPAAGRRPPDVRLARHRRARPGVRARHRHPGGRRADQPRAAQHPARLLRAEPGRRRHRRGRAGLRPRGGHRDRRRPRGVRAGQRDGDRQAGAHV